MEALDLRGYDLVVSQLERLGARRHPRRATPSTSATATTRSATPGTRARRRWPSRDPLAPRGARRRLPALAPVGLDRRPARRPLRRRTPRPPAGASRATSGATSTVLYPPVETARFTPGRGRRRLRRALGADAAQAHRPRRRGVQRAAPAADRRRQRARRAPAAAPGRPDDPLHRPRERRRAPRQLLARGAGARRDGHRGVRHRRGRGAGRRPAGHRAAPRAACARRSIEGETGVFFDGAEPRRAGRRRCARFDAARDRSRRPASRNAERFDVAHFRHGLRARRRRARWRPSAPPRAARRAAPAASRCSQP